MKKKAGKIFMAKKNLTNREKRIILKIPGARTGKNNGHRPKRSSKK